MIWVDITNLPHVLFFENFIKRHDAFVTTRDFGILTEVLESKEIEYVVAGRHGKSAKEKLVESSFRAAKLAKLVSKKGVTVGVSKHSVELPRVCFGLGIPCIQVVDNEYAEHQNRLTLPLCSKIITPRATDVRRLLAQGAEKKKIVRFNGVCEFRHIKNYKPREQELENYVVVRPEPFFAAYFNNSVASAQASRSCLRNSVALVPKERRHDSARKTGIHTIFLAKVRFSCDSARANASAIRTQKIIRSLRGLGKEIVVIPRGNERYRGALTMRAIDSLDLIYHADAFVGGGGTMNRESALLGTPAISYYPNSLLGVDRFLIKQKLMHHAANIEEILRLVEKVDKRQLRKRAKNFVKKLEDPFKHIEREISNLAGLPS